MSETLTRDTSQTLTGVELIRSESRLLPNGPGVYRMLDGGGNALYVGKAKNLKKRVQAYTKIGTLPNRLARMVSLTAELVVVTTHTEVEALLLEANLIKSLRPRFNVLLRDDKSFPYILFRRDHPFAQIMKHRGAKRYEGEYFGPFATTGAVNRALNTLEKAFLLRSCSDTVFEGRSRPCLLYQIKRCSAPCVGRIGEQDYNRLLKEAMAFLRGQNRNVQERLSEKMDAAARNQRYEEAAAYRDRIRALTQVQAHQDINVPAISQADVVAAAEQGGQIGVQVFFLRNGLNLGGRTYFPQHDKEESAEDVLASFLSQFYDNKPVPAQILVNHTLGERRLLEEALATKAARKVRLQRPQRGDKRNLIDYAERNAAEALERRLAARASQRSILEGVAATFDLEAPPDRIEVYDNSHISGTNALGAMIVAGEDGLIKNAYRKFNIKRQDLAPGDDYAMIREVFERRFARLARQDPDQAEGEWPDLVMIDGGAGQMKAAQEALAEVGVTDVPLMAIAKGPNRNAGRERFFLPGREPFSLEPRDPVLYFLQRLRDEAHRFALGGHRQRRSKATSRSLLDDVPGIGPKRKRALLHHFGSAQAVAAAGVHDLRAVTGISAAVAQTIYDHFHAK